MEKETKFSSPVCVVAKYADVPDDVLKDSDGDGLSDAIDACPFVHSMNAPFLFGCPDHDGDNWADVIDPQNNKTGFNLVKDECTDENCRNKYGEIWGDHFLPSDTGPKPPPRGSCSI